jgi:lysophospholipase L1-like esterase
MQSRSRRRFAHATLAAAGLVVALGIGEVGARVWNARRPVIGLRGLHVYQPDRPWLYGLRPGAEGRLTGPGRSKARYRINADGFRGPLHARPKPAGVFRVLVLGDSVAFGYDVEEAEAFPRGMEAELGRRAPDSRIEVVNLGVGGYNPWNEAALLADVGLSYEPDLVLVQFCANDLNDPTVHFDGQTRLVLSAIPDEAYPNPDKRLVRSAPARWDRICLRSGLCTLTREVWLRYTGKGWGDEIERFAFEPLESEGGPEWTWLERYYVDMANRASERGAGFAILMTPHPAQLVRTSRDPIREQLTALAARRGWPLIDPLPAFRAAQSKGSRMFLDQWHPTPEGHRILAGEAIRVLACGDRLGGASRAACRGYDGGDNQR